MKKRMDMIESNYYMRHCEGLDMPGVSDLASARGHEGTRTNQGSSIVYITGQHEHSPTYWLLVEASLIRLTRWFHIHLFLLIFINLRSCVSLYKGIRSGI